MGKQYVSRVYTFERGTIWILRRREPGTTFKYYRIRRGTARAARLLKALRNYHGFTSVGDGYSTFYPWQDQSLSDDVQLAPRSDEAIS